MPIHPQMIVHLEQCFSSFFKEDIRIHESSILPGSAISQAHLLHTSKGLFFMKRNAALFGHDFFEKEARGLDLLANAGAMKVARPLFDGKYHQEIFVVMEYLEKGSPSDHFWSDFGRSLANLHRHTEETFGLSYDNYVGKIHQRNNRHASWSRFYSEERILPLVSRAVQHKLLDPSATACAENLCKKMGELVPEEKPSLIHGDLWHGNFMVWQNGKVAIFDPALYYGHREMDLAMSRLFGGFDEQFYESYQEAWPLVAGYNEREPIHQLYPLLVHLLLFGGHYRQDVESILKKFA